MAAKAGDSDESTGFLQPLKSSCGKWKPPPRKHCIAQVTGGLGEIYTKIESGGQNADEDFSKCINEDNFFQPNSKGGLMAGRYQVIRVLGRGNSSTILQAQDTFRPGLYEVAIKVLKPEYFSLGYQESHLIAELNKADSHNFCGIVKLLNTFTLGSFFCMTFELLRPYPLHQVFKKIADKAEKLVSIRKVALRMLQILGFLGQQNVIHADLKPENILCNSENISDGIKVIDFGNAIHGVYEELSLYYDEFELQTLLYRAPEVLFGLPFGQEIDMWSLGCILAELYLGKPLFWAKQKKDLLTQMTSLFGPLPTKVYQRAKFFTHFKESVGQPLSFMDNFSKFGTKLDCSDFKFVSFLQGMLTFDPSERMSVSEAIQHPFMAPEMAIKYVLPFKINGSEASGTYSPVDLTPSMYTHTPAGTLDSRNKHLTSLELLHQGTRVSGSTTKQKVIHVVAPFEPSKSKDTETPGVKVEPKSEQGDGGVEHSEGMIGGVQLPEAPRETIKKPSVGSIRVLKKRDASVMTKSSSSEHQHPQEPVLKKNVSKRSKQSLKIQKKPLKKPGDGDGDVEHGEGIIGGVRLPEALQEATKKPSVKSVRVLKKQDPPVTIHVLKKQDPPVTVHVLKKQDPPVTIGVLKKQDPPVTVHVLKKQDPPVTIGVLKKHDAPVMTKSSSSEHQHSQEPVFKEDRSKRSKQSLKIQQKPLISQPLAQVESDSKPCHAHGKEEHLTGVGILIDSPKEDDPLTPDQTLKKTKGSTAKSKLNISEEETSGPDAKSEGTPGSPGESSHQFRYLKQQSVAAVSHKSKSLGVNMKKLRKSPVKLPEKSPASNSKRKRDRCKGTSESSSDVRKSDCSLDNKGMLICDEKKSVHPKKDVTLLVERVQKKKVPRATSKGKSEDPLKGHHQKSSTLSIGHKQLKDQERTSVYEFIVTPETKGKRSGSRKRSLQMAGDSVVKRSRRKRGASGSDVNPMNAHPVDNSLGSSEKCLLEGLNFDSPSSEMKQSEARLSSSSKPSSEPTSLTSKMSVLSRLQAAGDNKTVKHSISSPSRASSSSSSSRPLSAKSSLQSCKRWSLESSPLQPDQPAKTVVRSERKRGAKAADEHSPGTPKRKQKAKLLPSSPSSSESPLSPVGMPSLLQLSSPSSSSSSRPLPSKRGTKPRLSPVKQSSPALQIRRLFKGASSSRMAASPQQWRKASPIVQGQRKDIKATEAELQDQSDEEDEILLL